MSALWCELTPTADNKNNNRASGIQSRLVLSQQFIIWILRRPI